MADQDGSIMQVSVMGDREIHVQERERERERGREEGGGGRGERRGGGRDERGGKTEGGRGNERGKRREGEGWGKRGERKRGEKKRDKGEGEEASNEGIHVHTILLSVIIKILFTSSSLPFPPRKSKPLLPPLTPAPRPSKGVAKQNR